MTLYRSAQQGAANPADVNSSMVISRVAPYWRVALQHQFSDNYVELGTFGIASKLYSKGISGEMSKITDVGFDFQFERRLAIGAFSLHSSLINEREVRDTSSTQSVKIDFNSFKVDGNLYLNNGLGATLGYFIPKVVWMRISGVQIISLTATVSSHNLNTCHGTIRSLHCNMWPTINLMAIKIIMMTTVEIPRITTPSTYSFGLIFN